VTIFGTNLASKTDNWNHAIVNGPRDDWPAADLLGFRRSLFFGRTQGRRGITDLLVPAAC
jgi:hypothetical protein